jgi:hypothetical protein
MFVFLSLSQKAMKVNQKNSTKGLIFETHYVIMNRGDENVLQQQQAGIYHNRCLLCGLPQGNGL